MGRRALYFDNVRKRVKLKHKYNLTLEELVAREQAQGGKCAICLQPKKLVVDHDHITGQVRGLLCQGCNVRLGQVEGPWFHMFLKAASVYVASSGGELPVKVV